MYLHDRFVCTSKEKKISLVLDSGVRERGVKEIVKGKGMSNH